MEKKFLFVASLIILFLIWGFAAVAPIFVVGEFPAFPENPGSCSNDLDCIGISWSPGCVGKHWVDDLNEPERWIDETISCECVNFPTGSIFGLSNGKICKVKE